MRALKKHTLSAIIGINILSISTVSAFDVFEFEWNWQQQNFANYNYFTNLLSPDRQRLVDVAVNQWLSVNGTNLRMQRGQGGINVNDLFMDGPGNTLGIVFDGAVLQDALQNPEQLFQLNGPNVSTGVFMDSAENFCTEGNADICPDDTFDYLAIMTHEIGHALGIAHSDSPNCDSFFGPTMCPFIAQGPIAGKARRSLERDDRRALKEIYGRNTASLPHQETSEKIAKHQKQSNDSPYESHFLISSNENTLNPVQIHMLRSHVSPEDLPKQADLIVEASILNISEIKWNQNNNQYWVNNEKPTSNTAVLPYFSVSLSIGDVVKGEYSENTLDWVTIGSPEELKSLSVNDKILVYLKQGEMAWKENGRKSVYMGAGVPQNTYKRL